MPVTYFACEYVLTHLSASFPQNSKFFHERPLHILRHLPHTVRGTAVAQWLMCCYTNRKAAGSIPAGVLQIALRPWGRLSL